MLSLIKTLHLEIMTDPGPITWSRHPPFLVPPSGKMAKYLSWTPRDMIITVPYVTRGVNRDTSYVLNVLVCACVCTCASMFVYGQMI